MTRSSDDTRRQQVVRLAFELQHQETLAGERKAFDDALQSAALEDGLTPELLARAEAELLRREKTAAEARETRRRRRRRAALALGAAAALGVAAAGAYRLAFPPAPAPRVESFDVPERWDLHQNPESRASVEFEAVSGRGQVARLHVEAFGASAQDGKYFVNLDSTLEPLDLSRYATLSLDVRGTLPVVRVFLEARADERWRSPPLDVQGTEGEQSWRTHRVPLTSFERQVRRDGAWKTVSWSAPGTIHRLSVKVGHFMNPPEAKGEVQLDDLRLEP